MKNADFLAQIPHQIEADWDEHWGPLLVGFPLNIMYVSRQEKCAAIWSLYNFDLSTFSQSETAREMTYRNTRGGDYSVRIILRNEGTLEVFKRKGEKLVAATKGRDFDNTLVHATMIGVQSDESATHTELWEFSLA